MLEKLKEYKELIGIIVFFLGGFFWLNDQFPTKLDLNEETDSLKLRLSEETDSLKLRLNEETDSLKCLLEKYMTVTQLQIRNQEREKHAKELAAIISGMESSAVNTDLSPAMKSDLDQRKSDLDTNRKQRKDNNEKIEAIMDELARDGCGR
jgi:uncharacterized membrane-anchored protein YhcB (DUF1043 family)